MISSREHEPGRLANRGEVTGQDVRERPGHPSWMSGTFFKPVALLALGAGVSCILASVLAVALGAVRPAPDLTSVLGAPPCAAPCWHGIIPGVTSLDAAVVELRADPAVEDLTVNVGSASWWWNSDQSAGLSRGSEIFDGRLLFQDDAADSLVDGLALFTSFRLGDVRNLLGPPDQYTLHTFSTPDFRGIFYEADYGDLRVFAALSCPLRPTDFWNTPVGVAFGTVDFGNTGEALSLSGESGWPVDRMIERCSA